MANVARARKFAEQFGIHQAHPGEFLDPLPANEADDWDELLKKI